MHFHRGGQATAGGERVHAFCEHCGTPVYSCVVENPTVYSLRVGALAQRYELGRPLREIWTKRKLEWIDAFRCIDEYEGQP